MARLTRASQILFVVAGLVGVAALGLHLLLTTAATLREVPLANPPGAVVTSLAMHPADVNARLVGTTTGVFLTQDRGHTWQLADLPSSWCAQTARLLYDVDQPDSAYALGAFGLGVSRDGGTTWSVAAPPPGAEGYLDLLQSPVDGTLYIVAGNGLLRSQDHGDHWMPLPLGRDAVRLTSLAVHPTQADVLYAGSQGGLLLSTDRGVTWNAASGGPSEVAWVGLSIAPDGYLLAYTSSGIYQSSDGGVSFVGTFTGATEAGETDVRLAAADRGALAVWLALAVEPARLPWIESGDALLAVTPAGSRTETGLAAATEGLYETTDHGLTWAPWGATLPAAPVDVLASAPDEPTRLYATTPSGLSISDDGGASWQAGTLPPATSPSQVIALAVDPDHSASVYALVEAGALFRSDDGGGSWVADSTVPESMRTTPASLTVIRGAEADPNLCLLADRLYCAPRAGEGGWSESGPEQADARPVALLPSNSQVILITQDGSAYSASSLTPSAWTVTVSGGNLDARVVASGATSSGDTLYALTESGTLYVSSGDTWGLLQAAPWPRQPFDAAVLLAARGSNRVHAMALTGSGVASWGVAGTVKSVESVCPLSARSGALLSDGTGAGAYLISSQGSLSHVAVESPAARDLAPWLAAVGGLLAAGALLARGRERRRTGHPNRTALVTTESAASPIGEQTPTMAALDASLRPHADTCTGQDPGPDHAVSGGTRPRHMPASAMAKEPSGTVLTALSETTATAPAEHDPSVGQLLGLARRLCDRLGFAILSQHSQGDLTGYMVDASRLRLSLPAALPLVVSPIPLAEPQQSDEVSSMAAHMGAVSPFTLVLTQKSADTASTVPHQPDQGLIVLDTLDVYSVLEAENPTAALLDLIQRDVPLAQISPFVQSGPVNRSMFFGREYETKALQRALYDRSFAIVGGRKIGKTSFLGRVHQRLEESDDFAPLYVDCHHVADDTGFLKTLSLVGGVPVESASVDVLRRVVMRLRGRPGNAGRTVVLELDEVDNLLRYDLANGVHLFRTFRALSDEGLCRFVLCGERVLDTVLRDPALPLQGFCGSLRLGYLTQEDALRLVREPLAELGVSLQDPEGLTEAIIALSGRHPNILQAICQLLVERVAGRQERIILFPDVDAVGRSSAFHDLFFEVCWGNATTIERLVSVLMALRQQFSKDQVRLALEGLGIHLRDGELTAALEGLVLTSLITPTGTGYSYTSEAFSRVLGETGFAQGFRDDLAETLLTEQSQG
jgi:hypothetical protein